MSFEVLYVNLLRVLRIQLRHKLFEHLVTFICYSKIKCIKSQDTTPLNETHQEWSRWIVDGHCRHYPIDVQPDVVGLVSLEIGVGAIPEGVFKTLGQTSYYFFLCSIS